MRGSAMDSAVLLVQVPGDLFVYAAPIWMRLPLNHVISLAWTMILAGQGNELVCRYFTLDY